MHTTNAAWSEYSEDRKDVDGSKLRAYQQAVQQQKNAFLLIFQNFSDVLIDHISRCEDDGAAVQDTWFNISMGVQ